MFWSLQIIFLAAESLPDANEVHKACFQQLSCSYDPAMGGFSKAPKFPQPVNFNFLFHYSALKPKEDRAKQGLKMALHTLDMMAKGGIHDHVSQVSKAVFFYNSHFNSRLNSHFLLSRSGNSFLKNSHFYF